MDTKKHLMNLSRLRQLGPQQFTKTAKAEKGQAFFNYLSVFFFLEKKTKISDIDEKTNDRIYTTTTYLTFF